MIDEPDYTKDFHIASAQLKLYIVVAKSKKPKVRSCFLLIILPEVANVLAR